MNCLVNPARSAGLLLVAALALLGSAAQVQAQVQPQITAAQKQEMKLHYERATRAYDVGKYQEAIEEYQKAYEIGGDPPMLYNIAQAYRLSDQPADAVRFYRRYLLRSPNARNREDVERKIGDLERTIEERKKAAAAAPPPPPPTQVPTTPPPVQPPPLVQPVTPPPALTVKGTGAQNGGEAGQGRARKIVAFSLIGAGAIAGGVAIYEAKVASDKANQVSSMSRKMPSVPFDPSLQSSGKTANTAAIVLGITGGVAAAVGAVVLFTGGSSSAEAHPAGAAPGVARVTPWLGPTLVGAGMDFRF
jgi:tetratricopeptide (TPR) repeat protein